MASPRNEANLIAALQRGLFKKTFGQALGGVSDEALLSKLKPAEGMAGYADFFKKAMGRRTPDEMLGVGTSGAGAADSFQQMTLGAEGASAGAKNLGYKELLKNKDFKGLLKKPGTQLGLLFLAQMLASKVIGDTEEYSRLGMQEEAIQNQMNMSPQDAYYQASLPDLMNERKMAQMALMQSILGGDAGIQVPGERRI